MEKLYNEMDIEAAAKEVGLEVLESDITFEGIDYEASDKYIAANCSRMEIAKAGLSSSIPQRKHKKWTSPGITTN